jgi:hypothetical protein
METAGKEILAGTADPDGSISAQAARAMGDVFRSYNPFMRQYSSYINNFDNSLARMRTWTAETPSSAHGSPSGFGTGSKPSSPAGGSVQLATVSMGLGMSSMAPTVTADSLPTTRSNLTAAQRKRIKSFLKVSAIVMLLTLSDAVCTARIAKSTWRATCFSRFSASRGTSCCLRILLCALLQRGISHTTLSTMQCRRFRRLRHRSMKRSANPNPAGGWFSK